MNHGISSMSDSTGPGYHRISTVKNSGVTLLALGLSAFSQVLTQILIAYLYGAGATTDAFFAALVIPVILFWAIHNSAKISLVTMFTEMLEKGGKDALWQAAGNLFTVITLSLVIIAVISSFLSPYIIHVIAPGLDTETSLIAANILRILFFTIIFAGIIAVMISIQNIFSRFFVPAMNNFERAVFVIIITIIFYKSMGIYAVAAGFVAGSVLQCLVLLPGLKKDGFKYRFGFSLRSPDIMMFISLTMLPFLSLLLRQGNTVIDRFFASFLSTGSISAISYSYIIANGFILIVSGGLSAVSLPEFSRYALIKRTDEIREVLQLNIKLASIISFPLTVLLFILGKPIIRLLYERGSFSPSATELTSSLLSIYAAGIFFLSVVPVILGVFYAFKDTVTPFIHLLIVFFINIILAIVFMKFIGIGGLALALSAAGIISFIRISYLVKKKIGFVFDRAVYLFWMKTIASSIIMGIVTWLYTGWTFIDTSYGSLSDAVRLVILPSCVGFTIFCISAYILKIEGRNFVIRKLRSSLRRSISTS